MDLFVIVENAIFFFFMNEKEKKEIEKKCCDFSFGKIYNYCKEIYFGSSFGCIKTSIIESFKLNLFNGKYNYKEEICDTIKILFFIFFFYFFLVF